MEGRGQVLEKWLALYPGREKEREEVRVPKSYLRAHPSVLKMSHWALPLKVLPPSQNINLGSKPLTHGPLRDIRGPNN